MTEQEKVIVRALREAAKKAHEEWKGYALSRFNGRTQFAKHEPAEHLRMVTVEAVIATSEIVIPEEALS